MLIRYLFILCALPLFFGPMAYAGNQTWLQGVSHYIFENDFPALVPVEFTSAQYQEGENQLAWDGSPEHFYRIEQSKNGGDWQFIAQINALNINLTVEPAHQYQYRMATCHNQEVESCSGWSATSNVVGKILAPTALSINEINGRVTVQWQVNGEFISAPYFKLAYRIDGGSWQYTANHIETSVPFLPPERAQYEFTVSTCTDINGAEQCSEASAISNEMALYPLPETPVLVLNHGQYNVIQLDWGEDPNASYYDIRVFQINGFNYTTTTAQNSYAFNDNLPRGEYLTFQVKGCTVEGSCSNYSNSRGTTPLPWGPPQVPLTALSVDEASPNKTVTFSWLPVEGADRYEVIVLENGTATVTETVTGTSVDYVGVLFVGNPQHFHVRACTDENACSAYSEGKVFVPPVSENYPPPRPWIFTASTLSSITGAAITFNWEMHESYDKAVTFNVFSTRTGESKQTLLSDTNSKQYQHVFTKAGEYTLQVQACDQELGCGSFKNLIINIQEKPFNISGEPVTSIEAEALYIFVPVIENSQDLSLSYLIENKPEWANFNSNTGELTGTPQLGDEGSYPEIKISVTDGNHILSLPVFDIQVLEKVTESKIISIQIDLISNKVN